MLAWRDEMHGDLRSRIAALGILLVSITGHDEVWRWRVKRGDTDVAKGWTRTLLGAEIEAEDAAHQYFARPRDPNR
ncbi:hypothetical protein [Paracraurococcus ruber]|uniref:hypothetical protein n=1 Tax=Paracraurococcus ruber TaxID=77675 RepID=UPI00105789CE|nr:hypothetical protein [Paracraurococcus ruber]TDG18667.1 hypothetical protein E2C05_27975 [Paracraurococcus ruber]